MKNGGNMTTFITIFVLGLASILATGMPAYSAEDPPAWVYPVNPPGITPPPDDGTIRRVPGSTAVTH
jgi:hypothetical protein